MFHVPKIFLLIYITFFSLLANCQNIDSVFTYYEFQYRQLMNYRGYHKQEIDESLEQYKKHGIISDSSLAQLTKTYYPNDQNMAIIIYFHYHDTLKILLLEPGKIIER